ncbi:hypothetical protein ABGB16_05695 [Micromonospora sp. B11E3]|uniref:hypothetical protein n=1 Tax=Micromonospora sp. B11E3 TaxID=3153562 RepID=UPI00325DEA86
MSHVEDRLYPDDVLFVASLVVANHDDRRPCQQCTEQGCDQLAWAKSLVDLAAANMAQFRALVGSC